MGASEEENRARRYRDLARELRVRASTMTDERTRQGMLEAAKVWDQLSNFADRQVRLFAKPITDQRRPRP